MDAWFSIRALLACHRAVFRCDLAAIFSHKPVGGHASSEPVLPHTTCNGFNGVGTFQRATRGGSTRRYGILCSRRISGELANCCHDAPDSFSVVTASAQRESGTIMDKTSPILVYSDYKSPYAFLAKDLIYELEDHFDVHLEWLPYTLDIPSYLGSARLDDRGEVIEFKSERPPMAQSALLVHGLPATSPQTRPRNPRYAQDMGLFYCGDRHVVG